MFVAFLFCFVLLVFISFCVVLRVFFLRVCLRFFLMYFFIFCVRTFACVNAASWVLIFFLFSLLYSGDFCD